MALGALRSYVEEEVLSADPITLVRLLYRGAIEAVEAARQRLAERDIFGRSRAISKAVDILGELVASLNHQEAPEVSRQLVELYDYMQRRLLAAHFEQADAPLAEVLQLLRTLAEAWNGAPGAATGPSPLPDYGSLPRAWNTPSPEPATQGWTF